MNALLFRFWGLCLMRLGPQDLPYSIFLLLFCTVSYALVGLGVALLDQALPLAIISTVVDTGLLLGLAWLGLWVRDRGARRVQTITALTGTGTLFGLLGWPLIAWLQQAGDNPPASLSLLLLALIIWNIAVIGNILGHALDLTRWMGTAIALLYVYTSLRVMSILHIAGTTPPPS